MTATTETASFEATSAENETGERITIWPHRSLSRQGKRLLLGTVGAVFACIALRAALLGAWPLVVSAAIGFAILAVALRANDRAARMAQIIELAPDAIRIREIGSAAKRPTSAEFNPYWVRVLDVDHPRTGNRLVLRQSGRAVTIGDFLSPEERSRLALELRERIRTRYALTA